VVLIVALLKEEGQLERSNLYVTSADELLVQEILQLRLSALEVDQLDALHVANGGHGSLRACLDADQDGYVLGAAARAALSCHVHDLASDASFREFETVVCARPLREYGVQLQQRALGIFSDSLCGFGVLQIDPSSVMRTLAAEYCFAPVLPGQGLYRRLPR
jgi:chemotaxis protein methyltransferase CheR